MSPSLRIKAISFDGDATLWDFGKVMRHSLGIVLAVASILRPGGHFCLTMKDGVERLNACEKISSAFDLLEGTQMTSIRIPFRLRSGRWYSLDSLSPGSCLFVRMESFHGD